MEAKAHLRYARISPRKVQIVCDLIRGKSVAQATAILMDTPKAASELLLKLLKSAAANAENNHEMDPEKLYVSAGVRRPRPHHQADACPGPRAAPIGSTRELLTSPSWWQNAKGGGRIWDRK